MQIYSLKRILVILFISAFIILKLPLFIHGQVRPIQKEMTKKDYEEMKEALNKKVYKLPKEIESKNRELSSEKNATAGLSISNDPDQDGLSNREEQILGTQPNNPDTDGDGLRDGWEVYGYNGYDLHKNGASPLHKDIFVEMDYMKRSTGTDELDFDAQVVRAIETIFKNSKVKNPDGITGINIHLERGNEVPYDALLDPVKEEFIKIKANNFNKLKAPIFHYMIWADRYYSPALDDTTSSGLLMAPVGTASTDFIVTLGAWENSNGGTGGTFEQKVGTFIHELGHNLGLRHGGLDDMINKPNHLSVMNYFFQMDGVILGKERFHTYQSFPIRSLNESRLYEKDGLGKTTNLKNFYTTFFTAGRRIEIEPADGEINWDGSGGDNPYSSTIVAVDLNGDTNLTVLNATPSEWEMLKFKGNDSPIGKLQSTAGILATVAKSYSKQIPMELTTTQYKKLK